MEDCRIELDKSFWSISRGCGFNQLSDPMIENDAQLSTHVPMGDKYAMKLIILTLKNEI